MKLNITGIHLAIGAAAIVGLVLVVRNAKTVGTALGGAVVEAADGAVTGTVKTIGEKVGIPDTNVSQCQKDMAAGDSWAASFSCPAKTFIAYMLGSKPEPAAQVQAPEPVLPQDPYDFIFYRRTPQ